MIAIVTDSTAYLSKAEAAALSVQVVPLHYTSGGIRYAEGFHDAPDAYPQLLLKGGSVTSQASPSSFVSVFSELTRRGFQVLCIVLSSRLSGTFSSAYSAAKEVDSGNIAVVDSLTTAGGLTFLIRKARELAGLGLTLEQTAEAVENARDSVGVAFSVEDMVPLRRSGRIGAVRQSISTVLNIRPILLCRDGFVASRGFVRGKAAQQSALIGLLPGHVQKVIVHHFNSQEDAKSLSAAVRRARPTASVEIVPLGPVLGIHLGRGTIAVAWSI